MKLFFDTLYALGKKMSFTTAGSIGSGLGWLMWNALPKRRKLAIEAIKYHLKVSDHEAKRIARASFTHNCQSFLELFCVPQVTKEFYEGSIIEANPGAFEKMNKYDGPVVGITAHLGAWEILAGILGEVVCRHRAQSLVVVRKNKNEHLHNMIVKLRGGRGAEVVDHREAVFTVLKALRKKNLAAFLVDHNCKRNEAIFLPFLNKTAAVNMGPAVLASRSKAAVWPVFLIREAPGRYTYFVEEPLLPEQLSGSREEKVLQVAEFYTKAVEKYVRLYPEQWFWMHKRWKTRPENE